MKGEGNSVGEGKGDGTMREYSTIWKGLLLVLHEREYVEIVRLLDRENRGVHKDSRRN
jgi:hypothetical protein